MKITSSDLSKEEIAYLIHTAAGLIEDLQNRSLAITPDNVRKLLNRDGVSQIIEASRLLNKGTHD